MNRTDDTSEQIAWQAVPAGTFVGLAERGDRRRRRRRLAKIAAATACSLAAVWIAVGVATFHSSAPDSSGFEYAGIRCGEVRELLPAYLAGTLPADQAARVRAHTGKCSICSERLRRAKAGLPIAVVRPPLALKPVASLFDETH